MLVLIVCRTWSRRQAFIQVENLVPLTTEALSAGENKTRGRVGGGGQIGRYSESFLSPRWADYERISLPIVWQGG